MAKAKAKKLGATKKASQVKNASVGFAVKYQGLGSTIHQQPVSGKKAPKGVFSSLTQAKKFLVTRLKADVKKDLTRISKLKDNKATKGTRKASTKARKGKRAPAKTTTVAPKNTAE